MPRITAISITAAQNLGREYGLDVVAIAPIDVGSQNSNFVLRTRDQKPFILGVYEGQTADDARAVLELTEWLGDHGIPLARPLRLTSGSLVTLFDGKPVSVHPYPPGMISCQRLVTSARCREVGAALAKLHCMAPSTVQPALPSKFGLSDLRTQLEVIGNSGKVELYSPVSQVLQGLDRFEAGRSALPEGVIHGELVRDSVVWEGDRISGLLNFESGGWGRFAYDLGLTILAWCYGDSFEEGLVRALLAGYQSVRPLDGQEIAALRAEASIAALRVACTRLADFSMRVASGVRPARDYQRYLQRLTALEGGVIERCL